MDAKTYAEDSTEVSKTPEGKDWPKVYWVQKKFLAAIVCGGDLSPPAGSIRACLIGRISRTATEAVVHTKAHNVVRQLALNRTGYTAGSERNLVLSQIHVEIL